MLLRTNTGERTVFSVNSAGKSGYINVQKNGIRYLSTNIKINSK
jgi:hypothetical protein